MARTLNTKEIDFERASLLLDIVVKAGQHGPIYQKLASAAGDELKAMLYEDDKTPKLVTPAAGPANSMIQNADGSLEQRPEPIPAERPKVLQPGTVAAPRHPTAPAEPPTTFISDTPAPVVERREL